MVDTVAVDADRGCYLGYHPAKRVMVISWSPMAAYAANTMTPPRVSSLFTVPAHGHRIIERHRVEFAAEDATSSSHAAGLTLSRSRYWRSLSNRALWRTD